MTPEEEFEQDDDFVHVIPDGPPVIVTRNTVTYEFSGDRVSLPRNQIRKYADGILVPISLAGVKGLLDS